MGELEDAGEVDLKDLLPVGEGRVFGGVAQDGARVVDEDVDAAESVLDLREEILGSRGGGEVGAEGGGLLADGGGGFGGGAAIAVAGDGGSRLRERRGDGRAEAAGGAGDESNFVVEAEEVQRVQ